MIHTISCEDLRQFATSLGHAHIDMHDRVLCLSGRFCKNKFGFQYPFTTFLFVIDWDQIADIPDNPPEASLPEKYGRWVDIEMTNRYYTGYQLAKIIGGLGKNKL